MITRLIKNRGYAWAALAAPLVLLSLAWNGGVSRALVAFTGVKISPRFSGGEIERTVDHGRYRTSIHHPVFDGLTGERAQGFIQVDWEPVTALPETLREELDVCGGDQKLLVILDTRAGNVRYENRPACVVKEPLVTHFRSGWAVRISLKRKS